ncbi:MAG: acyl-CoA dehydrogenase family protein [Dehalococcoidia bacterium]
MTVSEIARATRPADELLMEAERLAGVFRDRAGEHDRDGSFPFENFEDLRAAGLLNLTVPADLGGEGQGLGVSARVLQVLATGCPSTALVLAMQYLQHAGLARSRRWPPEVYEEVVTASMRGIALINALRVEPELGTPARRGLPATTARRTAGGWSLSGRKVYSTGAPILSYFAVWAKTDEDVPRVGSFLVPRGTPGIEYEATWDHLGMRATGSHDVILADVEIPTEFAVDVRAPSEWGTDPAAGIGNSLAISAIYYGIAASARDWIVRFAQERTPSNLGKPLATLPRFHSAIGEIETLLLTNERLIYGLAAAVDRDGPTAERGREAAMVKFVTTNNDVRAVQIAVELAGNPGLTRHSALERHLRDVLCARIHTPQDDSVLTLAGRAALAVTS